MTTHRIGNVTLALALTCASTPLPATAAGGLFHVVCGKTVSIGAPTDVHARSELFGFTLSPVITYDPADPRIDYTLGVSRADENAIGLMAVLSAALVSGKNVTVWYRPKELTAACAVIQQAACLPVSTPPDAGNCLSTR